MTRRKKEGKGEEGTGGKGRRSNTEIKGNWNGGRQRKIGVKKETETRRR